MEGILCWKAIGQFTQEARENLQRKNPDLLQSGPPRKNGGGGVGFIEEMRKNIGTPGITATFILWERTGEDPHER